MIANFWLVAKQVVVSVSMLLALSSPSLLLLLLLDVVLTEFSRHQRTDIQKGCYFSNVDETRHRAETFVVKCFHSQTTISAHLLGGLKFSLRDCSLVMKSCVSYAKQLESYSLTFRQLQLACFVDCF